MVQIILATRMLLIDDLKPACRRPDIKRLLVIA
jgi:hypothetical protein